MAETNKRSWIHILSRETTAEEGRAQIARLQQLDGRTKVRMTRVIIYEGDANHLGTMLTAPGAFLQPGETPKCGSLEAVRLIEVIK